MQSRWRRAQVDSTSSWAAAFVIHFGGGCPIGEIKRALNIALSNNCASMGACIHLNALPT
jgi:hypothetical protein